MVLDLEYGSKIYDWWSRHPTQTKLWQWITYLGKLQNLRKQAIHSVGLNQGDTVLDLACGDGVNFQLMERIIGLEGNIIAFEYSKEMLGFAKKRADLKTWRNIQFIQGDAAYMELPNNSLDGAFCSLALSVIPDHKTTIKNVFKALKNEKHFVVLDAKLFEGFARLLNPIARPIFKFTTNWNYNKDIIGSLKAVFGKVRVQKFNSGSLFIAVATKSQPK